MGVMNRPNALYFATGIDNSGLIKGIAEAKRLLAELGPEAAKQSSEMQEMFGRIKQLAAGYLSVVGTKQFVSEMVKVRGEFQQLDIAMTTMLGSKSKSDKLMGEIVQLAAKTPFSLTELGKGAKQLIAFKAPADQVAGTLRRIGDIAAGVSAPVGELVAAYG